MKYTKFIITSGLLWIIATLQILAQCPMCKAAAEANLKEGGTAGMGLNAGILYLFLAPFTIVTTIAAVWFWTRYRNKQKAEEEIALEREQQAMVY